MERSPRWVSEEPGVSRKYAHSCTGGAKSRIRVMLKLNGKNRLVELPIDCSIERPEEASDVVGIVVKVFLG